MKKFILLIALLPIFGLSQTKYDQYNELISKANNLKNEAKYEQAINKYKVALDILNPDSSTPYFNLSECAIAINDFNLANEWIRKGISVGGAPLSYLMTYDGFSKIQNEDFYIKIIADYNKLRQEYFTTIENIDLYLEVKELTDRDQFVRKINDYITGRSDEDKTLAMKGLIEAQKNNDTLALRKYRELLFPKPNKEYQKLQSELMQKIDSLNIQKLIEITKNHGWQKRAWIILWHQRGNYDEDNYVWNYFRPLINREIEEGKISRDFWQPFDQFKLMMNNIHNSGVSTEEKTKTLQKKK